MRRRFNRGERGEKGVGAVCDLEATNGTRRLELWMLPSSPLGSLSINPQSLGGMKQRRLFRAIAWGLWTGEMPIGTSLDGQT